MPRHRTLPLLILLIALALGVAGLVYWLEDTVREKQSRGDTEERPRAP